LDNFKNIHIGELIHQVVKERNVDDYRISKFFNCNEQEVKQMYLQKSIDTELLLSWGKLLKYDFFRIYSHHLALYSPPKRIDVSEKTTLPVFKKNIYTIELINFILEKIDNKSLTKKEVMEKYNIPKTTLYKWIRKYQNNG
jgi:hypothetical protein